MALPIRLRFPRLPRLRIKYGSPSYGGNVWHHLMRERETGSWQKDLRHNPEEVRTHPIVFAVMSLIANDIAKCRPRLMGQKAFGDITIWQETSNPAYSPVINQPNSYQDPIDFLESWVWSLLGHGNFYGLKMRDNRNMVTQIFPLDPWRVLPLVANDGSAAIFYQLSADRMTPGLTESVTVPAREIIHSRINAGMTHPLVGVSPLMAAWLPAVQGLEIQKNATRFFRNGAQPSGVLTGPGQIDPDTAKRLEDKWENDFQGDNIGKIAVLGSGLKFETMSIAAQQSQVVQQLKFGGEQVCSTFHVPPYKVGLGNLPAGLNIQAMNIEYLAQALQSIIEKIERKWSDALQLGSALAVKLDLDKLLRMDAVTQMDVLAKGVQSALYAPNEGRRKLDLPPTPGGESPYLQMQNYSLAALAKRDASDDPFESVRITETGPIPGDAVTPPPPKGADENPDNDPDKPPPGEEEDEDEEEGGDGAKALVDLFMASAYSKAFGAPIVPGVTAV